MWYINQADVSDSASYPGVAKFGIALEWGSRGREFDSRHSDHKSNDFTLEIVGFFVYKLASFGFDHNFDHNAKDFIWSNLT